jgi:two-component system cell cycle response regulator
MLHSEDDIRQAGELRYHELKAAGDLPSPTGVALELLDLIQRDDSTIAQISKTIKADPALSGRLLKFANSPFVGQRRAIVAIRDAVLLVGMQVLRQLVLGLSVLSNYRKGRCENFDYQLFWSHSVATAVATQALCSELEDLPADEGFTCGLLSGVGKLALATVYPNEYSGILQRLADRGSDFELLAPERTELMIDHVELGAAMVKDWGLPELHYRAIQTQYEQMKKNPEQPRSTQLAAVLDVARALADVCVSSDTLRSAKLAQLLDKSQRLGLDEAKLTGLFDGVVSQWCEWGTLLQVKSEDVPRFATLLDKANESGGIRGNGEGLRVLVVDDDPVTVQVLTKQLRNAGHAVLHANDGRQALELAMSANPQLVITDWLMPEMNGLELVKALRNTNIGRRIYIIVVTAQQDENYMVQGFEAGADDYLIKPIEPRILQARIRASQRLIALQLEVEREREENRQYLSDLAVANRRLEQASLTDPLTGLPNRRQATYRLHQTWSAAVRNNTSLACMVIDIDDFKQINDTYGHVHGDTALKEVALVLRAAARSDDEVCRIGGEEFLIICADIDEQSAIATAERLRDAVAGHKLTLGHEPKRVTISVGVTVRSANEANPDKLLAAADKAVYKAKHDGKNRIVMVADDAAGPHLRAIT